MINSRPNILVIQADQLAANAIGAYQNPIASTPYMDSLADNGVIFDSAYTNLLKGLHRAFNGRPDLMGNAIGSMFELKNVAGELLQPIRERTLRRYGGESPDSLVDVFRSNLR